MFRVFALDFQSEHAHLFESSMITQSKMADFRKNLNSISEEMDSENELEDDNVLSVSHKYSSIDESQSKENEESDLEEPSEMSSQHDDDVLAPKPKRPRRSSMATQEDGTELDPDKVVPENDFNAKKEKSTGKKGGPKSLWTTEMLDDLVDIIVSNERYKRKLIFTNCPTTSNAVVYQEIVKEMQRRYSQRGCTFDLTLAQTRNKFKKMMSTCKTALMTVKTASGIKRFQDQKELGQWFNRLLQLMKSRASCQPRQAIEPGSTQLQYKDVEHGSMEENSPEPASSSQAEQLERNEAIVPEKQSNEICLKDHQVQDLKSHFLFPSKREKHQSLKIQLRLRNSVTF